MKPKDFALGQEVFVEPYRHRREDKRPLESWTVTKIGRSWVTIKPTNGRSHLDSRFDPERMVLDTDGGMSPSVWLTREAHAKHVEAAEVWRRFQNRVRNQYATPRGLAPETVRRWIAEFDAAEKAGGVDL